MLRFGRRIANENDESREIDDVGIHGADGVRREHDFQRTPNAPWQALLVEREAVDGEMRCVGTEQLRELRVNGKPVTAVSLVDAV
ncbi:hypothetical protein C461_05432 [Halorubrum aidingense JCM 13560]|uniref:Uncharacterized protein n=1 Tax=Halorubrum aidingense JCM 13560 TaxID=1230454 RepID=M0PG34_9EURY|nr:hypothetical protein [Halorubrum aidingense]EMA69047.1 hypothetical protein C461_05432 [Halorubrum aidingense JCM 13560]